MSAPVDIVVAGGGMVGAAQALALSRAGFRVAVYDPHPVDSAAQPSFDQRTVALTWASRLILDGIGVWRPLAALGASPIRAIVVSNRGHFGLTRLDVRDAGTEALGYVVPNRHIGRALHEAIDADPNVSFEAPVTVTGYRPRADRVTVSIDAGGTAGEIEASLLVIADGGRSGLAGGHQEGHDYGRTALVTTVQVDRDHADTAYEHFTTAGPLALLPAGPRTFAVVWTLAPGRLEELKSCDDAAFLDALEREFGLRAGRLVRAGERLTYPLRLATLSTPVSARAVVIGDAAHTVHPVAGQGFNLGLRDVLALAAALERARRGGLDIGAAGTLSGYERSRRADVSRVSRFTDGLIQAFGSEHLLPALARNAGLSIINLLPGVRRRLLRRTMGLYRLDDLSSFAARDALDRGPGPGGKP